ncbi:MAG: prolipoprotein diacylglyceryl transferase [Deltaproteobacteria bacterium]|nr:prolipoprotein diacylglyceryl transferase [Deltaproteobacteria bacterium]MBW1795397.1 prolipoprotein diacylglyceryl transferase [Deltaproteobacteria bacterium]MBW2331102.1 prolipoprotein diacylglyceryl transferase [Deltaproteobacteria bacterium]
MYPVLFRIGPFTLHTYGVFIAMAFLSAIALALREARREDEDANKILDLCFYMLVAAIVGSRTLYVLINWSTFRHDPFEIVRIWQGGLVFYGGFIGALLTALWYMRRKGLPLLKTADIMAPSIAFGLFVGRIGCFFAGCCYGKTCDLPWAVIFTHPESLAPKGVPLHPTQLYSSLNGLFIFFVLVGIRRIKGFEGQIFWTYVLLYSVTRSIIEHFRGDERGMFVEGMFSTSQLIGLIMAVIAIAMMIMLRRRESNDKRD